jgi:hypothetical protein
MIEISIEAGSLLWEWWELNSSRPSHPDLTPFSPEPRHTHIFNLTEERATRPPRVAATIPGIPHSSPWSPPHGPGSAALWNSESQFRVELGYLLALLGVGQCTRRRVRVKEQCVKSIVPILPIHAPIIDGDQYCKYTRQALPIFLRRCTRRRGRSPAAALRREECAKGTAISVGALGKRAAREECTLCASNIHIARSGARETRQVLFVASNRYHRYTRRAVPNNLCIVKYQYSVSRRTGPILPT